MGFKARKKNFITLEQLRDAKACLDQVELFERTFPGGVEVNDENVARAVSADLDVVWAARALKLTMKVEWADGHKEWYVDGRLHRDGGLPAVERADGFKQWHVDGKRHRDGGLPAVEWASGDREWHVDDKLHRDGGLPAVERADGDKEWWVDDKLHRDGGLPAVEWASGSKEWWVDGKRVR